MYNSGCKGLFLCTNPFCLFYFSHTCWYLLDIVLFHPEERTVFKMIDKLRKLGSCSKHNPSFSSLTVPINFHSLPEFGFCSQCLEPKIKCSE